MKVEQIFKQNSPQLYATLEHLLYISPVETVFPLSSDMFRVGDRYIFISSERVIIADSMTALYTFLKKLNA